MPRKPKAPLPGPTPIRGRRPKAPVSLDLIPLVSPSQELTLPEKLQGKTPTTRAIGKGTYQNRLLAHFAPEMIVSAFSALKRACQKDDMTAVRHVLESFGIMEPRGKTSVVTKVSVNQANQNAAAAHAGAAAHASGTRDFEDIVKKIEEDRKTIDSRNREFDATPEGAA